MSDLVVMLFKIMHVMVFSIYVLCKWTQGRRNRGEWYWFYACYRKAVWHLGAKNPIAHSVPHRRVQKFEFLLMSGRPWYWFKRT